MSVHSNNFYAQTLNLIRVKQSTQKQYKDIMAEWSKATDLSSVLFGGAGSNPADVILKSSHSNISQFILKPINDDC